MESHRKIEQITKALLRSNSVKDNGMLLNKDYIQYLKEEDIVERSDLNSGAFFDRFIRNVIDFVD